MHQPHRLFLRLSVDPADECVYQGERQVKLTPKAFAVLRHVMARQGRLATRAELMAAVWPDAAVTDASLTTCINEIRRALRDDPAAPTYIQTVHRRGYRYIGGALDTPAASQVLAGRALVGRDRELASLARSLGQVEAGERRLMLVGGGAGIGKTTLVEHFATEVSFSVGPWIARGQCVEQYGACEPYLPWFDVLNHLARDYGQARLVELLRRCAPMWLAQLPWLIDAGERQQLQREIAGATRERMIRELAETLEALAADRPVVVILEDLHWSDPSSIGLLAYLARRTRPGRLLLVGTYRPTELHVTSHPLMALKQDLLFHGACEDLSLGFLSIDAVAEYVQTRLPGAPDDLARHVHQRTDGNPLFIVNVIDDLFARGALVQEGDRWHVNERVEAAQTLVPESLKELIERQLDRLSPEDRRVLEAASVAGATCSAAAVAAALEEPIESAEERLGALARRGSFVSGADRQTWPDGTHSDSYTFIHVLYQNVLYDRIGITRRTRMHRQLGERLEAGYGDRVEEIAAELALHFQRGRDSARAVRYLALAGANAIQRSAYVEAIALLSHGLVFLSMLPEGADRDAIELELQVPLGVSYINTRGYAATEVGSTFERAHALCRKLSEQERLFCVLRGLWIFTEQRADLRKAQSLAEELLDVAERHGDPSRLAEAHRVMTTTWFHLGNFSEALTHVEHALAFYEASEGRNQVASRACVYGQDTGVCCFVWLAWAQWYRGYPDRAVASVTRGVELARQIGHPFSLSYALNFAARLYLCRREPAVAERLARDAIRCAQEHGLTPMLAMSEILHGWSRTLLGAADEAIRELEQGIARWRSTGARLMTPYWMSLLASALDEAGRTKDALRVLQDALAEAERSDERWFECDLYLLKASLIARVDHGNDRRESRAEIQRDLRRALRAATEMASPPLQERAENALNDLLPSGEKV